MAKRPSHVWRLLVALSLLATFQSRSGQVDAAGPPITPNDRFGADFVSAPGVVFSNQSQRYAESAAAGASWNRWPLYWSNVEMQCNELYDWSQSDGVVSADVAHGMKIDAILMGTPSCYSTTYPTTSNLPGVAGPHGGLSTLSGDARSAPSGLYLPTFADNTDVWLPGKAINPANPWARFVNAAVARYRGQIENWEIWNEPDNSSFWTGSQADYVRLLKVAYLAAHAADSSAQILVGGMMYWQWANAYGPQAWLKQFLSLVTADPSAAANGFYFDVIPWHWYSRSSDVFNQTASAQSVLASYGLSGKQLWLNESNSPACDDSGPGVALVSCGNGSTFPPGFANDIEQASFMIQATADAFAVGMTRVFEFQLQDDGNGQAFGMYRNDGSVRPLYTAYQLAAQYLEGWTTVRRTVSGATEMVTFGVPGANAHRTTVVWNDTGQTATASLNALGIAPTSVSLVLQTGATQAVPAAASYAVLLAPATDNRNYDSPWNPNDYTVGGPTAFLVEYLPNDTTAPSSTVAPLAVISSPMPFFISWSGGDPGGWGIFDYAVQYNDLTAGGGWINLLTNTTTTSAVFTPIANHTYQFRTLARDWAGNVEAKGINQADTTTTTSGPVYKSALPLVLAGAPPGW